mgnify:FL=1
MLQPTDTTPHQPVLTCGPMPHTLWDISPPIHSGSPVFPGDTPYSQQWVANIGPTCPVNVSAPPLSPHVGAHADAPLHYDPAGQAVGELDLTPFIGPCRVIHALGCGPLVRPEHLAHALPPAPDRTRHSHGWHPLPPRVLVRVYARMPQTAFDTALPALAPETLELLADLGVRRVGPASPSSAPADSQPLPSHQTIRRHGLRVLENLLLDDVPEGDCELIALPLKLMSADASPVRAVLRPLPGHIGMRPWQAGMVPTAPLPQP